MTPPHALSVWASRWRWARRLAVAVLVLVAIVLLGRGFDAHWAELEAWVAHMGPWGMLVLVVVLIVATSLLVPESVFGVAAGALYGIGWGFALLLVANVLAAALQYGLARTWCRPRIQHALDARPTLAAIRQAVTADDLRLQLLLRIAPLNPAVISYLLGAAGVRFPPFLLACLALTPHLLLEVYLGDAGARLARMTAAGTPSTWLDDAVLVGGIVAGVVAVVIVSRVAYRAVLKSAGQTPSIEPDDTRP